MLQPGNLRDAAYVLYQLIYEEEYILYYTI